MELFPNTATFNLSKIKGDLEPLCYKNGKTLRSYQQFFRLYYFIRLLRYANQTQLKSLQFSGVSKVATKEILKELVNLGHISIADKQGTVFIANETTDKIIRAVKFNEENYFKVFSCLPQGIDTSNDIKNTEVFIQAISLSNYYFLLFPDFDYIIPDALLVLKEENRYKLTFLEIETEQSNWTQRLERMRSNYLRLSKDIIVYDYWRKMSPLLKLPVPDLDLFKFSITIIGNISKDWGNGFEFRQQW